MLQVTPTTGLLPSVIGRDLELWEYGDADYAEQLPVRQCRIC